MQIASILHIVRSIALLRNVERADETHIAHSHIDFAYNSEY